MPKGLEEHRSTSLFPPPSSLSTSSLERDVSCTSTGGPAPWPRCQLPDMLSSVQEPLVQSSTFQHLLLNTGPSLNCVHNEQLGIYMYKKNSLIWNLMSTVCSVRTHIFNETGLDCWQALLLCNSWLGIVLMKCFPKY